MRSLERSSGLISLVLGPMPEAESPYGAKRVSGRYERAGIKDFNESANVIGTALAFGSSGLAVDGAWWIGGLCALVIVPE